ncbi:MAG: hypothetical protein KDB03_27210 [Planctomycetales bacterium]|nr:hypothetical protein [Planctomycetales bacterium]
MSGDEQKNAKPIDEFRLGNVRAAIWENISQNGKVFYSTTFDASYTDETGQWRNKKSFSLNECLRLEKVAGQAAVRIQQLNQEAAKGARLDTQADEIAEEATSYVASEDMRQSSVGRSSGARR